MNQAPKRRWFQFRLSSLLWLMTVIALLIVAISERRARKQIEQEYQAIFNNVVEGRYLEEQDRRRKLLRKLDREIEAKTSILSGKPNNQRTIRQTPLDTDHSIGAQPVD